MSRQPAADRAFEQPVADAPQPDRMLAALWRFSTSYTLLLAAALLTLVLTAFALFVPQLPSQHQSNPAAATRWLLTTSSNFGVLGPPLRSLGIFDLIHNPVFQLLIALVAYFLAAQFARLLGIALAFRSLPRAADARTGRPGAPVPLSPALALARYRGAVPAGMAETGARVTALLEDRFTHSHFFTPSNGSNPPLHGDNIAESTDRATEDEAGPDLPRPVEQRILSIKNPAYTALRPLAVLGLLLAVIGLWTNARQGWQIVPPTLSAGETFRYPPRNMEIAYLLDDSEENLGVKLRVNLAGKSIEMPVSITNRALLAGVQIRSKADIPGIVIRTQPAASTLARLGEPATSAAVGLSFPAEGSEESLLLPEEAVGIRLVRLSASDAMVSPFIVEVYDTSQAAAAQSVQLDLSRIEVIEIDDTDVALELTPVPGLSIQVRYEPGAWLMWLGLAFTLAGAGGWLHAPRFMLVQLAPWPVEGTVVTAQSNSAAAIAGLGPLFHDGTET